MTDWSIERCAQRAHCAKGLVLHYFGTKQALLEAMGLELVAERWSTWSAALSEPGIGALDTLWDRLAHPSAPDQAGAILELRLAGVTTAALTARNEAELRRLLARALELPVEELPVAGMLEPLLEGYLLALLRGVPAEEVREGFFRYWLSYVR